MELTDDLILERCCSGKSILIAEDEEINYLFMNELMSSSKATLFWAQNGQEAVDIMLQHPEIVLVLMDIKMPKLNGYEAISLIKANNSAVKIIATTAYAFSEDKEKAMSVGCDSYVSKPINIKILTKEIQKILV